ncbi:Hypothetical protein NTJ_11114 [Nesidiocoris tenuis]|uniref:F5/8 type C domain-containing protein n=1 Tax=Nesidiocoris tenuis TaxID=355587 RepID=A0ABN7B361_9HEMI|nr:Hypothetical protein NTJ_11114 [Nesidiocoris tenuis]
MIHVTTRNCGTFKSVQIVQSLSNSSEAWTTLFQNATPFPSVRNYPIPMTPLEIFARIPFVNAGYPKQRSHRVQNVGLDGQCWVNIVRTGHSQTHFHTSTAGKHRELTAPEVRSRLALQDLFGPRASSASLAPTTACLSVLR